MAMLPSCQSGARCHHEPEKCTPFCKANGLQAFPLSGGSGLCIKGVSCDREKKGTFKVFFSAQGAIFVEEKMGLDDFTNPVCEGFMGTIDSKLGEDKDGLKLPQPGLKPGGGFSMVCSILLLPGGNDPISNLHLGRKTHQLETNGYQNVHQLIFVECLGNIAKASIYYLPWLKQLGNFKTQLMTEKTLETCERSDQNRFQTNPLNPACTLQHVWPTTTTPNCQIQFEIRKDTLALLVFKMFLVQQIVFFFQSGGDMGEACWELLMVDMIRDAPPPSSSHHPALSHIFGWGSLLTINGFLPLLLGGVSDLTT